MVKGLNEQEVSESNRVLWDHNPKERQLIGNL
jgi:hypothetical protein